MDTLCQNLLVLNLKYASIAFNFSRTQVKVKHCPLKCVPEYSWSYFISFNSIILEIPLKATMHS